MGIEMVALGMAFSLVALIMAAVYTVIVFKVKKSEE